MGKVGYSASGGKVTTTNLTAQNIRNGVKISVQQGGMIRAEETGSYLTPVLSGFHICVSDNQDWYLNPKDCRDWFTCNGKNWSAGDDSYIQSTNLTIGFRGSHRVQIYVGSCYGYWKQYLSISGNSGYHTGDINQWRTLQVEDGSSITINRNNVSIEPFFMIRFID